MTDNLYTILEAAKFLKVSDETLRRWEKSGKLIPQRTIGNHRRYSKEQLVEFKHTKAIIKPQELKVELNEVQPELKQEEAASIEDTFAINHLSHYKSEISKNEFEFLFPTSKMMNFLVIFIFIVFSLSGFAMFKDAFLEGKNQNQALNLNNAPREIKGPASTVKRGESAVLADTTRVLKGSFTVNIPAYFNDDVFFKGSKIDLGNVQVTGGNVMIGLTAGDGITVTTGNKPTIKNAGVLSLQEKTGALTLTAGSGIAISGLTISSDDKIFKTIKVGSTTFDAGSRTDTLEFTAGTGITLSSDTSNKKVTITGSLDPGVTRTGTYVNLTTITDSVGIGTATPSTFKLQVAGNIGPNADDTYDLGSASYRFANIYADNIISSGTQSGFWERISGALSPVIISDSLNIGATATSSALAHIGGTDGENSFFNSGNVGIGVTSPMSKLYVSGTTTITGQTVLTSVPEGSGSNQGSLYINPASAGNSDTLFGLAVGGVEKVRINGSGDIIVQGNILSPTPGTSGYWSRTSTTLYPYSIFDNITTFGNMGVGNTGPTQALEISPTSANILFSSPYGPHQIQTGGTTNLALMPGGGNVGIGTTSPVATFHNAGTTLFGTLALSDLPTGGNVGTAATTVDLYTSFNLSQSTASQTITLPDPTNTTAGRIVLLSNTGSTAFTFYGATINPGKTASVTWDGDSWNLTGDGGGGDLGSWTDGGDYMYPTHAEYVGNSLSGGSNKITGIYLADSAPLTFGNNNDLNLTFASSVLSINQGSNDVNFGPNILFVDGSAGNVGIGTSSPSSKLQVLGDTSSTTFNGLAVTNNGTNTLNIAAGKTLTASNSLTLAGTDSTTMTFPSTSTTVAGLGTTQTFTGVNTFTNDVIFPLGKISSNGNVGVGTSSPSGRFDVSDTSNTAASFTLSNNSATTIGNGANTLGVLDLQSTSLTTGNFMNIELNALTTGKGLNLTSTSPNLSSGSLASLDWSPTGSTNIYATGDLLSISTGNAYGFVGNFLNIKDNGTSVFSVSQTQITNNLPTSFTAPGDVSIAYDINMTNPTASYIKSNAPLYITAGKVFNSSDLVLTTYNRGSVIISKDFTGSAVTNYASQISGSDTTANANTNYGLYSNLTFTGNAAKTGVGLYSNLSTSSTTADTLISADLATSTTGVITTGTRNIYGLRSQPSSTGASTGGTTNVYGIYSKPGGVVGAGGTINSYGLYLANGTMDTTGTSTNYGLFVENLTGADNNYAAVFAGGNVGIGITAPNAKLQIYGSTTIGYAGAVAGPTNGLAVSGNVGVGTTSPASVLQLASGQILTANGTNSAPSYSFTNSVSTGMYSPSANALSFAANGVSALTVNSGGNVGIGTTAPVSLFDINSKFNVLSGGNVGIGVTNPAGRFDITDTSNTAASFTLSNNSATTIGNGGNTLGVLDLQSTSLTTGNFMNIELNALTSGKGLNLTSTSTALTSGSLASIDWSPTGSTNIYATGDLLSISTGNAYAFVGNLLNIKSQGTSVFSVSDTAVTTSLPTSFNAPGDVSFAYDIAMTNPTASYIKSNAPLNITAGETFNASDLNLTTYHEGSIILNQDNQPTAAGTSYAVQILPNLTSSTNSLTYTALYGLYNLPTVNLSGNAATDLTALYGNYTGLTATAGTIGTWYGNYIAAPTGSGTITNKYALVTEALAGNVGIGITAPGATLQINGNGVIGFGTAATGGPANGLAVSGNVGIGTSSPAQALEVQGRIRMDNWTADGDTAVYKNSSGDIGIQSSDIRLKKNITPLQNSLDIINGINGVTFNFNTQADGTKKTLGVIAQDVLKVLPEAVFTFNNNVTGEQFYGVHYEKLTALLIEGVKAQQLELNSLSGRISVIASSSASVIASSSASVIASEAKQSLSDNLNPLQTTIDSLSAKISQMETRLASLESSNNSSQSAYLNPSSWLVQDQSSTDSGVLSFVRPQNDNFSAINLDAVQATVSGSLMVLGRTTLSDLGVTGKITTGLLTINGMDCPTSEESAGASTSEVSCKSTLNSAGDLYLQDKQLAGINMLNGKITIDKTGNLTVQENALFAKDVTVKGVLSAKKVNIEKGNYSELSDTEVIASSSAGTAFIKKGFTQRKIYNDLVKKDSLIYITLISDPGTLTPFIAEQKEGEYFIIKVREKPTGDIKFNYLIINQN